MHLKVVKFREKWTIIQSQMRDKEVGKGEEVEDGKYDSLKYFSICSEYIHRRRESKWTSVKKVSVASSFAVLT